jgi:hypothetical protein
LSQKAGAGSECIQSSTLSSSSLSRPPLEANTRVDPSSLLTVSSRLMAHANHILKRAFDARIHVRT